MKRILRIVSICLAVCAASVCCAQVRIDEENEVDYLSEYLAQSEFDTPRLIADLVDLWEENGIYITLPPKELGSRMNEAMSWDRYIIADDFEILYSIYFNGTGDVITIDMPISYKPLREAQSLVISYLADMSLQEAEDLFDSLIYNVIDYQASRKIGLLDIGLYDFGDKITLQVFRAYDENGIVFPNG